jgi:hypothetical protein
MVSVPSNPKVSITDEVLDFLASTPTLQEIIDFRPSEALQEYVRYLLDQNRNDHLTSEEQSELEEISRIDHFMTMLKIRARKKQGFGVEEKMSLLRSIQFDIPINEEPSIRREGWYGDDGR